MEVTTPSWVYVFLAVYFAISICLFLYGMHAYFMAWLYHRSRNKIVPTPETWEPRRVTVQLPLFNERYVAKRLIDAVVALRYPADKLQIQVLDDSNDGSEKYVAEVVDAWRAKGTEIVHIHRKRRTGFKGGALREGLETATGELVAIFDADFIPPEEFLNQTVPHFEAPDLGMVQARWAHLNEDYSALTRAQAVALDGHFIIEQTVRNRNGAFINFNGTAGIWRKQSIYDAGNWQDDTLTEDLDLSYRAQLAGWRFLFLTDLECPAELPAEANGLKGQQFRWAKGSVQTAKKLLSTIHKAPISRFARFQATIHLTNHTVYPLLLLLGLAAFPALIVLDQFQDIGWMFRAATVLVIASFGHPWLYLTSQRARGKSWVDAAIMVPVVVAGNMGTYNNYDNSEITSRIPKPTDQTLTDISISESYLEYHKFEWRKVVIPSPD